MYKTEGYWNVKPKIKRLSFPRRGKFQVDLQDGRSVMMPISAFPSLKKVPAKEREKWYLMGGGVTWDSCPEVIHIEQILGKYWARFEIFLTYSCSAPSPLLLRSLSVLPPLPRSGARAEGKRRGTGERWEQKRSSSLSIMDSFVSCISL